MDARRDADEMLFCIHAGRIKYQLFSIVLLKWHNIYVVSNGNEPVDLHSQGMQTATWTTLKYNEIYHNNPAIIKVSM